MPDVVFTLAFLFFAFLFILFWMILKRKTKNTFSAVDEQLRPFEKRQAHLEHVVKDEIARNREETANSDKRTREELSQSLRGSSDSLLMRLTEHFGMYKNQLDSFSKQLGEMTKLNQEKLEQMRNTVERQLRVLQEENSKKLEQMRSTVDEKLQTTLEKRLGESFKQVSERLEQVYKGLGEMRSLASGVGDLKKVLTNVKTRGTWGEIRLGNILEQILTPEQYEVNVDNKKETAVTGWNLP